MSLEAPTSQHEYHSSDEGRYLRAQIAYALDARFPFGNPKLWENLVEANKKLGRTPISRRDDSLKVVPESAPDTILTEAEHAALTETERQINDPDGEYQRILRELPKVKEEFEEIKKMPGSTREEIQAKRNALGKLFKEGPLYQRGKGGNEVYAPIPRRIGNEDFRMDYSGHGAYALTPLYKRVDKSVEELKYKRMRLHNEIGEVMRYLY